MFQNKTWILTERCYFKTWYWSCVDILLKCSFRIKQNVNRIQCIIHVYAYKCNSICNFKFRIVTHKGSCNGNKKLWHLLKKVFTFILRLSLEFTRTWIFLRSIFKILRCSGLIKTKTKENNSHSKKAKLSLVTDAEIKNDLFLYFLYFNILCLTSVLQVLIWTKQKLA